MKLVSYVERPIHSDRPDIKLGLLIGDDCVADVAIAQTWAQGARGLSGRALPHSMMELLGEWADAAPHLEQIAAALPADDTCLALKGARRQPVARRRQDVFLLPPVPNPLSLRDFDGYEKHARNMYRLHSRAIPHTWYEAPTFAYGNPLTVLGPDLGLPMPRHGAALDFELEIAAVIGVGGQNITPNEAPAHIAGFMIMNDWSLRDAHNGELNVYGAAKGKDFATTTGPALVTPGDLADRQIGEGAELRYDLEMVARVNGQERSRGNFKDIHWTVAQMIARASEDVMLYPGEIIGTGTVASGCLLEQGAADSGGWLKPGDVVELEVERLGHLATTIYDAR